MEYMGSILVEDASGCRIEIHEYRKSRLFSRTVRNFLLDTGEQVRRLDDKTFVIATTGETLTLADD